VLEPTASERAALARAVALAETVRATTSPNPAVGCVLVRDGQVVAEGATAPAGGPHAEVAALVAAGDRARGATAVVTLEPCAHHGRTPPCTTALRDAGVIRVVIGHPDPNPVAAGGAQALRRVGLEVVGPLPPGAPLRDAVAGQLEGFLTGVRTGRPHLTLKLAQTVDGRLVAPDGARWITGAAARRAVHRWRAAVDAVLVGSGTILADDPRLDVREVPVRHQPRPVVLDGRLRTPPSAAVVARRALIVTTTDHPTADADRLRDAGAEVVAVPAAADGGGVDLVAALTAIGGTGVRSVLAEPGATLADALVTAGVADRVVLHVAAHLGTGRPARAVHRPPAGVWRAERTGGAGADVILHLVPEAAAADEIDPGQRSGAVPPSRPIPATDRTSEEAA
jgi:diaminohydroxyphosphoribosylaminopyrimidine deaminase / 5-amino-6-(5-phosphoribosylamino)uracil reductase